jgi:hypothetical protein
MALEWVGGGTLADKIADRPLPPAEAARLAETVARAVDAVECWATKGLPVAMNQYN